MKEFQIKNINYEYGLYRKEKLMAVYHERKIATNLCSWMNYAFEEGKKVQINEYVEGEKSE